MNSENNDHQKQGEIFKVGKTSEYLSVFEARS